jgi:RHS repeat-associated protein
MMRINKIDRFRPPSNLPVKIKLCDGFLSYMQSILTPDLSKSKQVEGRVVVDGSSYEYQYFLKDHLGNTRITFNESGTIIQEDSYYPYEMNMSGLSHSSSEDLPNKFLYNGKELQDDFGLGWYDYGFRMYDPQLGRWHVPDPKAEKYTAWTPYNYALNNPLKYIDPLGLEVKNAHEEERNKKEQQKNEAKKNLDSYKGDGKTKEYKNLKRTYNKANRQFKSIDRKYQSVETAIGDLQSNNSDLFNKLDNLADPGGTTVDVYVESVPNLKTDFYKSNSEFSEPKSAYGLTSVKGNDMGSYYSLQSKFGANTIGIALEYNLQDPGRYLSHEGGHAKYFAGNLKPYYKWLKDNPGVSVGGHGGGNPSGEEADLQEAVYLNNKK